MKRKLGIICALTNIALATHTIGMGPAAAGSCIGPERQGLMRADLNGNGTKDSAWVTGTNSSGSCRVYLVAKIDGEQDRARLPLPWDDQIVRDSMAPIAMVRIDNQPGHEIGVRVSFGANTVQLVLFTTRSKELHRVRREGGSDLFITGGSISYLYAIDCARKGAHKLVISDATGSEDQGWDVDRKWYKTKGGDLVRTHRPTQHAHVGYNQLGDRFPEFKKSPWGRCSGNTRNAYSW
jgi:hypothetical protein